MDIEFYPFTIDIRMNDDPRIWYAIELTTMYEEH